MNLPHLDYAALNAKSVKTGLSLIPSSIILLVAAVSIIAIATNLDSGLKPLLIVTILAISSALIVLKLLKDNALRRAKVVAFTAANGIAEQRDIKDPANYPGMFFTPGYERVLRERYVVKTNGNPIELGNYRYTTGHGKSRTTRNIGYMRLKLPRRLPNMVLDARANNLFNTDIANLPVQLHANQKLRLEGDFNDYFTLYAPQQYERDALYVFTPDVMATLVDYAKNYDIEIVEDDIFVYNLMPFDFSNSLTWEKLLALASKISPELEAQTDYYSDERVASRHMNQIAEPGKRLKSGVSWTVVAAIIIYFGISVFQSAADYSGNNSLSGLVAAFVSIVFWAVVIFFGYRYYLKRKNRS